jgi:penicillin G amidase
VIFAGADVPEVALLAGPFSITTRRLPLAADIPDGDPRGDLRWFPRPGDFFAVDAANAPLTLDADYTYGNGPVMRMVVELRDGEVRGQNILPGGQSGVTSSDHFDDQAGDWLGNQTIPMRFSVDDVVAGAVSREAFRP